MVVSLDMVDREILYMERGQRIAERMVIGVRVEEFYMDEEREGCMLEALGCEGLVQLCPTLRGLGYVVGWREGVRQR